MAEAWWCKDQFCGYFVYPGHRCELHIHVGDRHSYNVQAFRAGEFWLRVKFGGWDEILEYHVRRHVKGELGRDLTIAIFDTAEEALSYLEMELRILNV